jgi:hypothetical protein
MTQQEVELQAFQPTRCGRICVQIIELFITVLNAPLQFKLDANMNQMNPIHTFTFYVIKILINIIFLSKPKFLNWYRPYKLFFIIY